MSKRYLLDTRNNIKWSYDYTNYSDWCLIICDLPLTKLVYFLFIYILLLFWIMIELWCLFKFKSYWIILNPNCLFSWYSLVLESLLQNTTKKQFQDYVRCCTWPLQTGYNYLYDTRGVYYWNTYHVE
jgi:hypothetical protein